MVSFLSYATFLSLACSVLGKTLSTSGRWIVDDSGTRVKLRCVNWAGHMETRIPEGLQHQSVDNIATWIKRNNFNCVRLTYSIDMALNYTQPVADSFVAGVVSAGGSPSDSANLWNQTVTVNPFLAKATTLDVFAAVIDTLDQHGVMTILDNHVSHASWCCSTDDGNGFWSDALGYSDSNSRYFDTNNWLQGLEGMANFSSQHPGVIGMSVRNEIRAAKVQLVTMWEAWYHHVTLAANAIHTSNKDLLIMIGGLSYATDLSYLWWFNFDTSSWAGKTVWEAHSYSWSFSSATSDCGSFQSKMGHAFGFVLADGKDYTAPLWVSEFGVNQLGGSHNGGLDDGDYNYMTCLSQYLTGNDADWGIWALQGSYYIRDGKIGEEEGFGLLNGDWSDWRNPQFPTLLGSIMNTMQGPGVVAAAGPDLTS